MVHMTKNYTHTFSASELEGWYKIAVTCDDNYGLNQTSQRKSRDIKADP